MIDAIQNVLLLAGVMAAGGVVFVTVCMYVIRALDLVESNYD